MWYVRPAKPQISLRIRAYLTMIVKLQTENHLEFLSLTGGCRGSSESTHVKMPPCWKSHATAQISLKICKHKVSGDDPVECTASIDRSR